MKYFLCIIFCFAAFSLLNAQPSGKKVPVSPIPVTKDSVKNDPVVVKDSVKIKDEPAPPRPRPKANFPAALSLRKYCPDPGYIGRIGSDVGFAAGYGAMTVESALINNLSDIESITRKSFSPYFTQSLESAPTHYVNLIEALAFLKEKGNYHFLDLCNPDKMTAIKPIMITKTDTLFLLNQKAVPADTMIYRIKQALNAKHPVILRIKIDNGLNKLTDKATVYKPMIPAKDFTGTAFLLTGYKDTDAGGSFELMGHRGTDWADKGFFYMSYTDLLNQLMEAYTISLK